MSADRLPANLLEALLASFDAALRCPEGVAPPVAMLWTDADGQWKPLLPALRTAAPQLYTLGAYDPANRTGPVIWLKCIIDRTLPDDAPPESLTPILYLPGVDRQHLRAAGECPEDLQPLIELQYRGTVWHQRGGRDWSVEAFLTSEQGLGLDVALDRATREAIQRSLPLLATELLAGLRNRRLEADDFDRLAIGDPIRDVLSWMSDADGFRARCEGSRWSTFRTVCMREFDFDPDEGAETAGEALLHGGGKWDGVWTRFCEAPRAYRGVAQLLQRPPKNLFVAPERQPNINAEKERALRGELEKLSRLPHHDACQRILDLDQEHRERRHWVWADLDESPLAKALEPLSRVARLAKTPLGGSTVTSVAENYIAEGWRCDAAALEVMASGNDVAIKALRVVYEPWLEKSAQHFQSLIGTNGDNLRQLASGVDAEPETCILFADGLRFDVAGRLQGRLELRGVRTTMGHRIAAMPTVTPTAKPLASPLHDSVRGNDEATDFTPAFANDGQPVNAPRLRERLTDSGVILLAADETRAPSQCERGGWSEIGRIDADGHSLGARLAKQIDAEMDTIVERILALLEGGWSRIKVVTDHGWLLLPGGLPKVELPRHLTATKWTRCAVVQGDSSVNVPVNGWHWNPLVRIATPPGIGSFEKGTEYSHGGISVQECVVPELVVERGAAKVRAEIKSISWRGMRCRVAVATNAVGAKVDLRMNWKQPATSIVAAVKEVGSNGEASLAIEDDRHEGAAAAVVVLDAAGTVLDHKPTTVGEGT